MFIFQTYFLLEYFVILEGYISNIFVKRGGISKCRHMSSFKNPKFPNKKVRTFFWKQENSQVNP